MTPRPRKSFADYIAIAISPLLIMVLVGSLAFFLLELGYHGKYESRLRWALFWFVIASVLVSRISIENGYARASLYGLGLSGAVALLTIRLIGFSPIILGILALIWWCTAKLTWDSTLIEDDDDSSGEGLLQAGGLQNREPGDEKSKKKKRKRLHAPGVWIVYFSLAALPLFGVGQIFLRHDSDTNRTYVFGLLWIYTAAALGLLMTTSFLGLRRYLRQRFLKMPALVSITWILSGAIIAAIVLAVCLILPRPDSTYSVSALKDRIELLQQKASTNAVMGGEAAEGDGKRAGTGEGEGQGKDKKDGGVADGAKSQAKPGEQPATAAPEPGGNKAGEALSKSGAVDPDGSDGSSTTNAPGDAAGKPPTEISLVDTLWKKVVLAVVVLLLLIACWFFRRPLKAILKSLIEAWRSLWDRLFHRGTVVRVAAIPETPVRPFAEYRNPFITGSARKWTSDQLVQYTFEALQAWAQERNCARSPEQTPQEFSTSLGSRMPGLAEDLLELGGTYTRFAYANQSPDPECVPALERVWQHLEQFRETR